MYRMRHLLLQINLYWIILVISFSVYTAYSQSFSKWQVEPLGNFSAETSASGSLLNAVAIDLDSEGQVYIIDRGRHRLLKFNPDGELIREIGGFGRAPEQFDDPRDIHALSTLDIFVADYNNDRVVRFDRNLNFLSTLTSVYKEPFNFEQVLSVAVSPQYDLFILENVTKRIIKISRFSEPTQVLGGINETYGQLLEPVQITLGDNQRLFVSDPGQTAIVVFDYLGNFVSLLSHPELKHPGGLFWGEDKKLYIVDTESNRIFVFSDKLMFEGIVELSLYLAQPRDVAVAYTKSTGHRLLYVLIARKCWIFNLKLSEKE